MKFDKRNPNTIPTKTTINAEVIPKELRNSNHWGLWKWELNKSKKYWTKVPCDEYGNAIDANYYNMSFEKVYKALGGEDIHGIGFHFSGKNDFFGVDLDDCVKKGKPDKKTKQIIKKFSSYTETSVSGTGIHIICKGSSKLNGVDAKYIYHKSRWFTFSTDTETFGFKVVKKAHKKANKLFNKPQSKGKKKTSNKPSENLSDITTKIMRIKPNLPEPDWFDVCKAIHSKSGGSEKGWNLFNSWSRGDYTPDEYDCEGYDEEECRSKWDRCKIDGTNLVGFPRLSEVVEEHGIRPTLDFSSFKAKKKGLIKREIHKRYLSTDLIEGDYFKEAAEEMARFNKVEVDPVLTTMLLVVASSLNKKVKIVERKGLNHNCSLGFLIAGPPGARKSAIDNPVFYPFKKFEAQVGKAWKKDIYKNKAIVKITKGQLKELYKELEERPEDENMISEVAELEKKVAMASRRMPKMVEGDITEEKLSESLAQNNETMLIQSDDARNIVKNITGRYDSTSESIYIAGLTGDNYRRSRVKDDLDIVLDNPCINMSLKVQTDMLEKFVENKAMAESGLIARVFLKIINVDLEEQTIVGKNETDLDVKKVDLYNRAISRILSYDGKQVCVSLSKSARDAYSDASLYFSKKVGDFGEWAGCGNVTNKVLSLCTKMAVVMKAIGNPGFLHDTQDGEFKIAYSQISESHFKSAWKIVDILMGQTIEVIKGFQEGLDTDRAQVLLDKLLDDMKQNQRYSWNLSDMKFKYSTNGREHVERSLGILLEAGVLIREGFNYEFTDEEE